MPDTAMTRVVLYYRQFDRKWTETFYVLDTNFATVRQKISAIKDAAEAFRHHSVYIAKARMSRRSRSARSSSMSSVCAGSYCPRHPRFLGCPYRFRPT